LEKEEKIDFDELTARLLEEEAKVDPRAAAGTMAMAATRRKVYKDPEDECYYCGQKGHWKKDCRVRKYREKRGHEDHKAPKYSM
jgi:hypothetical protein